MQYITTGDRVGASPRDDILPLIATTKRNRLYENLAALEVQLSDEDMKRMSGAFPEGSFVAKRYAEQQMALVVK